jgi:hypothetical protein
MNDTPEFLTKFAIADCAARLLDEHRPSKRPKTLRGKDCDILHVNWRREPVAALRWLWHTGDHMERHMVAARVLIWLGQDEARRKRVLDRLKSTVGPVPTPGAGGEVIVEITGGVGRVTRKPAGVAVEIRDYDIGDTNPKYLKRDSAGDLFVLTRHETGEAICS